MNGSWSSCGPTKRIVATLCAENATTTLRGPERCATQILDRRSPPESLYLSDSQPCARKARRNWSYDRRSFLRSWADLLCGSFSYEGAYRHLSARSALSSSASSCNLFHRLSRKSRSWPAARRSSRKRRTVCRRSASRSRRGRTARGVRRPSPAQAQIGSIPGATAPACPDTGQREPCATHAPRAIVPAGVQCDTWIRSSSSSERRT
jgi:hypothetical protein